MLDKQPNIKNNVFSYDISLEKTELLFSSGFQLEIASVYFCFKL